MIREILTGAHEPLVLSYGVAKEGQLLEREKFRGTDIRKDMDRDV